MNIPSPANMRALDWENYVVAQLAQAALGLIPRHAVAMGVAPRGEEIVVHFQLTEIDLRDTKDMDDIVDRLTDLLGDIFSVRNDCALRSHPLLDPSDGVRWVFRRHHGWPY